MRESVCILPGHGVPSLGCWGCVGGAVHGGTAESRVVPLRKKSDIREGRAQKKGGGHLEEELPNQNGKEKGGWKGGSRSGVSGLMGKSWSRNVVRAGRVL